MATKARQQYHADEATLSKERREFSISDDVQEKIDGIEEGAQVNTIETIRVNGNEISPDENKAIDLTIPGVIDSLSSTSITDALSARQGKILYDKIDNISRIGHFLALWDASTGLPVTDPEASPYEYHAGDFYIISVVASQGGTNYKPSGTEYVSGQASTAVETDDVEVNDFYFYDGQVWRHMKNSGAGDVVVDGSLSTTSRNPVENRVITNALSGKQNTLTAGANIQINGNTISATDTKYTAGTGISIANGVISNTQTSAERGNITGTLSDQTDLQTVLTSKATDANVVHKSGAETIAGTKTFSTSPVVPSKTTAATNTGTAIATEAQVYKKQDTLVSGTNIKTVNSNSLLGSGNITLNDVKSSATAPSNPTEGMVWYDTTNDSLKAYNGTSWETEGTKMVVLSYGHSTWQEFIDAYKKNAVVYCKASSNSNPGSGVQGRMAFMAFASNINSTTLLPTEVEFQYYRSRSSHSTAANVLDEVYVYKLTSNGTWSVTQRDTAAKPIAGTGIGLTYNASGMTISADTTVLATKTDLNSKQDTLVSGTNIKTINNNSLLGSGNLTLNDVKVSATAPASPTEGMVWYDTTNDVLKAYNGTQWNAVDTNTTYNAGEGIEIGTIQDYSAMRGPCPEGFHVPTNSELQNIINIGNALSAWSTPAQCESILNLTNHNIINWQGGYIMALNGAYIWSCTPNNSGQSYAFSTTANQIQVKSNVNRNSGYQIRPFKDKPVVPDNTRTTLVDGSSTATGAGIFSNPLLGLISLSGDGINWTTIAIKNLGAPDTTSAGYYYQWGNNNGFVANGYTTSETTVNASNYGPMNYYSSNVFIMGNNGVWDNSNNRNLRGGVTGVVALDNAISNTGVLSVNGQTGDVTIPITEESNTKTFYLSGTSDLTNAQAAYDWYKSGKNIIIVYLPEVSSASYNMGVYIPCTPQSASSNVCNFISVYKAWEQAIAGDNAGGGIYEYILYFSISGSTVTSINRSTRKSIANFLATDKTNRAYTPTNNYHPATKKYVDDSVSGAVSKGTTAPSNPTEGQLWYDTTNDILKVYNGTQWNAVGDDAADINTKTFYLSSTSDLTNAQAAVDWYLAGGNPIVMYGTGSEKKTFILTYIYNDTSFIFTTASNKTNDTSTSTIYFYRLRLSVNSGTVTNIYYENYSPKYLDTSYNYGVPYTPLYNGSPATKKYVDDSVIEYNAGEGIEIGTVQDYSAMRGPCPKGFHIMTKAEGTNLINAFKGLGLNGTASFRQYFKVPTTGQISGTTGQIGQSTTIAEFRLSETSTTTGKPMIFEASKSYALACGGTIIDSCSIRPYKDVPVAPDNSWTTLYDGSSTSTGAGIFHNSTLGLISISSDGTNWITIADKNLGATVVYNEGDAVSEINAGKLYQWGNNYGFPLTGATTTSSTKVDTTGYGPGNYYTSSTFITVSNNNEFWTNPSNPNLRGGQTGVVTLDNAISNTGVLSVNGQTGDVDIAATVMTEAQYGQVVSPIAGKIYFIKES